MFPRFNVPKVLYSEGSILRRFYVPKVYIPKVLCSEGSMFRKSVANSVFLPTKYRLCVLDADAYAHSDAQSDAEFFWVMYRSSHVFITIIKFFGRFARPPYLAELKKYYVFLLQR